MALRLQPDGSTELLDPFNGIQDLQDKLIRTRWILTLRSAMTRCALRAARFATQLGFRIGDKEFAAISRNKERIRIVSMERISDELNKIIQARSPPSASDLLFRSGLYRILPQLCLLHGVEYVNGKGHKDNSTAPAVQCGGNGRPVFVRAAILFHDIIAKLASSVFLNRTMVDLSGQ